MDYEQQALEILGLKPEQKFYGVGEKVVVGGGYEKKVLLIAGVVAVFVGAFLIHRHLEFKKKFKE